MAIKANLHHLDKGSKIELVSPDFRDGASEDAGNISKKRFPVTLLFWGVPPQKVYF
jgi:hypothetical protein